MRKNIKERIMYFIIPLTVVIITGIYMGFFYIDMFKLGTHFAVPELEIRQGYITGTVKNVGSYNVSSANIVATLKEKGGGYRTVIIPLDPQELEIGEETTFKKEIEDYSGIDNTFIRAVIQTR
jgi:hypothetical protein